MKNLIIGILAIITLNSCATIIGGSTYYANITVPNHPNAKIYYKNNLIGTGKTSIEMQRRDADMVKFKVIEEGYPEVIFSNFKRTLRGAALVGSIFSFNYYFIPIGLIVDLSNGSFWKPNINDKYISKIDYDNYRYTLTHNVEPFKKEPVKENTIYTGKTELQIQEGKLKDLKRMYEEETIDEQEYKLMKRRILGIEDILLEEPIKDTTTKIETEPVKEVEVVKTPVEKVEPEIVEENKSTEKETAIEKEIDAAKKEKISDLNKMLELEMITQDEYNEMKKMILEQD